MKIALATSAVLVMLSGVVNALPKSSLVSRALTPDGTCGGVNQYSCDTTGAYGCCSQYGWCGSSTDHCGAGCQSGFGSCTGTGGPTTPPPTGTRVKFGSVPYGVNINECLRPNSVAITFDDGPHIYTPGLLDIYKAAGAKATFFINGANWGASLATDASKQALVRRMLDEGHQVASHTWSHPDLSSLDASGVTSQMFQLETTLMNIIGKYPTYMRPPFLSCGPTCASTLGNLGYHIMGTNLDTQDWQYTAPDTYWQSQNIFKQAVTPVGANGKWLVLAHDVHQMTAENIGKYMIKKAREVGLDIVTVGECMYDPPANWYRTVL